MSTLLIAPPVRQERSLQNNRIKVAKAIRSFLQSGDSILRLKQIDIAHSVADNFELGERAIYLDVPTGVGKTVIFLQIVEAILRAGYRMKILIVTDSIDLLEQTKCRFEEHAPEVEVGLYYTYSKQTTQQVIITTYASLPYFAENHAEEFGMLVADEAHLTLSDPRIELIKQFTYALWLALTATPAYSSNKGLVDHFTLAFRMSVTEAVYNGLICGFRNIKVNTYFANLDKVPLTKGGDLNKASLDKEVNIYSRNASAAELYRDETDSYTGHRLLGKKGLISCVSIRHAYDVANVFNKLIPPELIGGKIACVAIHGNSARHPMPKEKRRKILEAHKNKEILLLAYSNLLVQGHDDEEIEITLNLAPSKSWVKVQQRAGRCLRIDKNNPSKTSLIIDFVDIVTEERKRALLYGDVVGVSACIPQIIKKGTGFQYQNKTDVSRTKHLPASLKASFLEKLKIYWSHEEVNSIIASNRKRYEREVELKNKQEDELSIFQLAKLLGSKLEVVRRIIERLQPHKKKPNLYFDPDRKQGTKPDLFHIVIRMHGKREMPYLKRVDFTKFKEIYFPRLNDKISVYTLQRLWKIHADTITKVVKTLKTVKGQKNLYYDPNDKNKKSPQTFHVFYEPGKGGKDTIFLSNSESDRFRKTFWPYDKKKKDDLSNSDVAKALKVGFTQVANIFSRVVPIKEGSDQYYDPTLPQGKSISFQFVIRQGQGGTIFCLKRKYLKRFKRTYFAYEIKTDKVLSTLDVERILKIDRAGVRKILNRLKLLRGSRTLFYDPTLKEKKPTTFQIVMIRSTHGNSPCLMRIELKKFAKCYGLEFRKSPTTKKKILRGKSVSIG